MLEACFAFIICILNKKKINRENTKRIENREVLVFIIIVFLTLCVLSNSYLYDQKYTHTHTPHILAIQTSSQSVHYQNKIQSAKHMYRFKESIV